MDFGISEEQKDIQNLARQLFSDLATAESLAPSDEAAAERFDPALWNQLAEAGLLGVGIDEAHGGMGFGFMEVAMLVEELGRTIAAAPLISHLVSAALPIQAFGSDEQKTRYLPDAVTGKTMLTAALMEDLNEDPTQPARCSVSADGDGFVLSGSKRCVPFARRAEAVLLAAKSEQGVVVLLVDPNQQGVTLTDLAVTQFEPQCDMDFDQVKIDSSQVLVGPENGAEAMRWITERTCAALCAHQLGVADVMMRMTASYTSERKQFGVPVATFQAVGHRAANCFIDIECLRLNAYQAASMLGEGHAASNEVAIAKIWAGDVGHRVSYASQHMHGGAGIDRDYPLWRFCLAARHNEMMLGSSAYQLARLGRNIAAGEAYCR